MKGPLKRKGTNQSESSDLQVFLLDNCVLIAKQKLVNNLERYKLYKKVTKKKRGKTNVERIKKSINI